MRDEKNVWKRNDEIKFWIWNGFGEMMTVGGFFAFGNRREIRSKVSLSVSVLYYGRRQEWQRDTVSFFDVRPHKGRLSKLMVLL